MIHDFYQSLAKSHAAEDLPLWEVCYRQFFRNFQAMHTHRQDGEHQRLGIDRSIVLDDGTQFKVDEKARWSVRPNGEPYDDILLEYVSNDNRKTPGWVVKRLECDFIAYANIPAGKCYLLRVWELQAAWKRHSKEWFTEYPIKRAPNNGYFTLNLPIPVLKLYSALGKVMWATFEPPKPEPSELTADMSELEDLPF